MFQKLISLFRWLISQDWRTIYTLTHTAVVAIAEITKNEYIINKADRIKKVLDSILGKLPDEQKKVAAEILTQEKKLIPDIDVAWDSVKGFQVSSKIKL